MNDKTPNHEIDAFTWQAHPARERPAAAAFAVAVIAVIGVVIAMSAEVWWGVLAVTVLILSLNRFFFPSRYTLSEQGVTVHNLFGARRCDWSRIRRFQHDRHGVYLSTRSRPSRLDAYQGVQLLFGPARDEVLTRIRDRLAEKGEVSCTG